MSLKPENRKHKWTEVAPNCCTGFPSISDPFQRRGVATCGVLAPGLICAGL